MRTRLIHEEFELDLSNFELNWTEENSWFKDEFFLNSSFPFEMDYSVAPFFEKFRHDNLASVDTVLDVKLEKDGQLEDAILEIEEAGDSLRMTVRYGVEALPNWTKKLSELDLDTVLAGGGSMATHAQTILNKTWPEVNYNFPAVISKFYEDSPMMSGWQGVINKRVDGNFVSNDIDGANTINRNIVYPLPYHLYVLTRAVEDIGCTLHGDILTDPDLIDACILSGKKIADFEGIPKPVQWIVGQEARQSTEYVFIDEHYSYPLVQETWLDETELNHRGYINLQGEINDEVKAMSIKLNGQQIFGFTGGNPIHFNIWFHTTSPSNTLVMEATSLGNGITGPFVIDTMLTTLYLTDEHGEIVQFFANFSNVNLATNLPDMTIGDFIKFHKKLKNYDVDLRNGNEVWVNLVENEVLQSETVDVSEFEPISKTRKYEASKSFLLKYDFDDEEYHFKQIYATRTGFEIDEFAKSENTQEVNINGIPLPISTHGSITTAVQVTDDAAKLMLVKYPGLTNGENWSQEMTGLDTLNLYLNHWLKWLNFMIHAVKFNWIVEDHPNLLMKIKRKSKLFAFNNLLFVYSLNRRRKGDVEEVEIEAYSTKI